MSAQVDLESITGTWHFKLGCWNFLHSNPNKGASCLLGLFISFSGYPFSALHHPFFSSPLSHDKHSRYLRAASCVSTIPWGGCHPSSALFSLPQHKYSIIPYMCVDNMICTLKFQVYSLCSLWLSDVKAPVPDFVWRRCCSGLLGYSCKFSNSDPLILPSSSPFNPLQLPKYSLGTGTCNVC